MGNINPNRIERDIVTICFRRMKRMRLSGIKQWNNKLRGKLYTITYSQISRKDGGSMRIHISHLASKERIGQVVLDRFGHTPRTIGYSVMLCGHGRTATGMKTKELAVVHILEDKRGNDYVSSVELSRYTSRFKWFLKKKDSLTSNP